jgi:hypothetical protein
MSEYTEPTGDDYGHDDNYAPEPHHNDEHVIVAQFTDGSQIGVADYDHDGYADILASDADGDGRPENVYTDEYGGPALDTHYVDANEDGNPEKVFADRNEDGYVDAAAADTDHDGALDLAVFDNNFDGRVDQVAVDPDEDGNIDKTVTDSDFDGVFDTVHYGDNDTNPYARV